MPPKKAASAKKTAPVGTAMETLYFKLYDEHVAKSGQTTAILLMVGKFFEIYDYVDKISGKSRANVQTLAELCGCTVEPRVSADPAKTRLFWGFPETSLPKFERILVAAGYTVVVVAQNKDTAGKVVDRTLDHISSPGTFWDGNGGLAIRRDEQLMLAIYVEPYVDVRKQQTHWYIAISAFDVMTGKSISTETDLLLIDGKPVCDNINPFFTMYPPAEVAFYWCASSPPPSETEILSICAGGRRPPVHVLTLDSKSESNSAADRQRQTFLEDVFKMKSSLSICEYLGVTMYHMVRRSLYNLLQFIKDHNPSYLTALHEHSIWSADDNVVLGNAALTQLSMTPTNSDSPHESLLHWIQRAISPMGRRALRERCLKPIADVEELDARQERVAYLRGIERDSLEFTIKGMYDLARLYRRFQLGNGTTDELLQLMATYNKAARLIEQTKETLFDAQEYSKHISSLLDAWDEGRIRASKSQMDSAVALGSFHPWKRGVNAELDAHEDAWLALEAEVLKMRKDMEDAIEDVGSIVWTLKDDAPFTLTTTPRRGTSIVTVMKRRHGIEITTHTRGSSTVTQLDSLQIADANARGLKIRTEWKAAVNEQWRAWWSVWMTANIRSGVLEEFVEMIGRIDSELALANVAEAYGYVRPKYIEATDDAPAGCNIVDLRHPIIERVHTSTPYIPHSLSLGGLGADGSAAADLPANGASAPLGILLYGVNAAGKSSLGKALGLAVLMAQCGIPVPASAMTLIPYTGIYTRILGNDNLWAGMSSFVVEMTEFRSILRAANSRTLVIGDELCAGTETASATAIVAAGIQTLVSRKVQFFFATHLHELAKIDEIYTNPAIAFYHLTVRSDTDGGALIYDRKLRVGCGSPMYGLEVCRGLDMDPEFLTAALQYRKRMFSDDGVARASRYNAAIVVNACEICGTRDGLETHHIVPQAAAGQDGKIRPGVHKNVASNLTVLCDSCHKAHHGGLLDIQGWVDTSEGRRLLFARV